MATLIQDLEQEKNYQEMITKSEEIVHGIQE